MSGKQQLQRPPGTRDLYPDDLLRRRYVTDTWRRASLRHGFDEIDGPTFETTDLYAVKSGEGILGELFQAFSGKSPDEVARVRQTGRAPFALRPEFTPTLARMYAAKANALPGPTKWFSVGPYFRAERPQRGRLREFLQWNADIVGLPAHDADDPADVSRAKAWADAETIATMVALLRELGLSPANVQVRISDRALLTDSLLGDGVSEDALGDVLALFDAALKMPAETFHDKASALGVPERWRNMVLGEPDADLLERFRAETPVMTALEAIGLDSEWTALDPSIVRGLAYYTGTVFEVVAKGERAIAGGGRYDSLVELFGGPPTPAVGFGLGDVVLSLLLDDLGLMPSGRDMLSALDKPTATRPGVFVMAAPGADEAHASIDAVVARFRSHGVHARRSFKTTRNIGKLMKDADQQHARLAVILEEDGTATLKGLDSGEERTGVTSDQIGGVVAEMLS